MMRLDDTVPEGFHALGAFSGFVGDNGPILGKRDERGIVFGFRVARNHCNPMKICHGGWLATFADLLLPLSARATLDDLHDRFMLTVNLSLDYLGPAPLDAWVEGRAEVLRRTSRMVFAQGLVTHGDDAVLRCSGVLRIGPQTKPFRI
jgi:uncharacterized protein (TIGR00369 family)